MTPFNELAVLKGAREIMLKAGKHSMGLFAQGSDGQQVDITSTRATSFCIMGAALRSAWDLDMIPSKLDIYRFDQPLRYGAMRVALDAKAGWYIDPAHFSNDKPFDDVIQLLDDAIALLEAGAATKTNETVQNIIKEALAAAKAREQFLAMKKNRISA